jgi:lysyl-tRNA synthetase class 1
MKGGALTTDDMEEIDMRIAYAKLWLQNYADDAFIFKLQEELPEKAQELSDAQKRALHLFAEKFEALEVKDGQAVHELTHAIKEESGLDAKSFFTAIYVAFLGKESGPKVGWFLSTLDPQFVIERLKAV